MRNKYWVAWAGWLMAASAMASDPQLVRQGTTWSVHDKGTVVPLVAVPLHGPYTRVRHLHDGQDRGDLVAALQVYRSEGDRPWLIAVDHQRPVTAWRGTGDEQLVQGWTMARSKAGKWTLAPEVLSKDAKQADWDCDSGLHDKPDRPTRLGTQPQAMSKGSSLVSGVLAIDTDTEFMSLKFGNNTGAATQYIQGLVAAINVIYEQDLGLRLTLGEVILRTGTDPYSSTDSFQQLLEVGNWWSANRAGSPRSFVAMLSGKSNNPNSANGIAWLIGSGNYCQRTQGTGGHYSLNRVFRFAQNTVAQDVGLVAHEIGHNLGAAHTHCTDGQPATPGFQPLDMCFNDEPSDSFNTCYSGPESCPAGGSGTLMSYCHISSASCGPNQAAFHPFHIAQLSARVAANTGVCFSPVGGGGADVIFRDGFETD